MSLQLVGSFVAIVTPFRPDGAVDYAKLEELVEFHIANGTDGVVPVGTTGESPTLTHEEHKEVISVVVKKVNKRIKVIAGTGSNSTAKTIEMTRYAKEVGADAALVVVPYYNKPTQEGLFLHFKAVAEVGLPVVLYNIPGRSGVNMTPATIIRLSKVPNIVAVKEATGSMDQTSEILKGCNITVLSGDDSLTLPLMSIGAKGVVSVIGNIVPKKLKQLVDAFLKGDLKTAQQAHYELFALSRAMFIETNPIPIKAAMGMMGLCDETMRLPMSPLSDSNRPVVRKALEEAGLVKPQ
jgi:4-hydroxy-tetrahydrodipicolinate synthase